MDLGFIVEEKAEREKKPEVVDSDTSGHIRAAAHKNSQWLGQYVQGLWKPSPDQIPA